MSLFSFIVFSLSALLLSISHCQATEKEADTRPIVLAYVISRAKDLPDPNIVTHINYAFAHVGKDFQSITIDNAPRLASIAQLKKKNPQLQILLSIGGWGSGRFSEMAADEKLRKNFAQNCKKVIKEYGIDGVDIDWEYPTSASAGISASPEDTKNYTLLMKDIREAIGKDKLLTLASVASGAYVDFKAIDPYVDFVNIMSYDMARPPNHHSALYPSPHAKAYSCDQAVNAHLKKGVPAHKLVLGIPFYGRGNDKVGNFINYDKLIQLKDCRELWDDVAKVPYLADKDGKMICSYDNPRSVKIKAQYVKKKGLRGIMYWQYNGDDAQGSLRNAVYSSMK